VAKPVEARTSEPTFLQVRSHGQGFQLREGVQKPGFGGGAIGNVSTITLNECTLSGNTAAYVLLGGGGGIDNRLGTVNLNQCTVSGNSASFDSVGGGIYNYLNSFVVMTNTILAGNSGPFGADVVNLSSMSFNGVNIIQSRFNVAGYVNLGPNPLSAAPLLAPLANYGGPTQTMPPLTGSPAIDACTNGTSFTTDQRGNVRVLGSYADVGAVEGAYGGIGSLTGLTRTSGKLRYIFTNLPNMQFSVVASTNPALPLALWANIGSAVESPASSGHYQFTDSQITNYPKRFYRVRLP
jgi:hypothetical protein